MPRRKIKIVRDRGFVGDLFDGIPENDESNSKQKERLKDEKTSQLSKRNEFYRLKRDDKESEHEEQQDIEYVSSKYFRPDSVQSRSYQKKAVDEFMSNNYNLIIELPTGLGKTYIAFDIIRELWEKHPTRMLKPVLFIDWTEALVNQQAHSARKVFTDEVEVYEVTGRITPDKRVKEKVWEKWKDYTQRSESLTHIKDKSTQLKDECEVIPVIYFATPETVYNDIKNGLLSPDQFSLIVFDEIHRKRGESAYAKLYDIFRKEGVSILGLTATLPKEHEFDLPVLSIPDWEVKEYTQDREFEEVNVSLTPIQKKVLEYVITKYCLYTIGLAKRGWIKRKTNDRRWYVTEEELKRIQTVKGTSKIVSTIRWYRLLNQALDQESVRYFLLMYGNIIDHFCKIIWRSTSKYVVKSGLIEDEERKELFKFAESVRKRFTEGDPKAKEEFERLKERLRDLLHDCNSRENEIFYPGAFALLVYSHEDPYEKFKWYSSMLKKFGLALDNEYHPVPFSLLIDKRFNQLVSDMIKEDTEHPKLSKLVEKLREIPTDQRIIVFAGFVELVEQITELINSSTDHRAVRFIGKKRKGYGKRAQREALNGFLNREYNVLVATNIGEEGFNYSADIAVLYDQTPEMIRFVQRIGRVGREHEGRLIVLLNNTEGIPSLDKTGFWKTWREYIRR